MDDKPRPRINTVCHECRGDQVIYKPTMYVSTMGPGTGTLAVPVPCPTCKGKGRLPGVQPPV